ncbi:DUF255 domain-containing protein [Cyclobacteriaceae bacterium]|nr:DUF255 domain-containing protein [Cyclobacteriaceae bacterium]
MKTIYTLIFTLLTLTFFGQTSPVHDGTGEVRWMDFEEVDHLSRAQKRPIIISVHTSWCGWCKKMEHTTYKDPQVTDYLNTYFYPISLDAESKDTITFRGKTYTNPAPNTRRSKHSITQEIMGQSGSYPTTVFMDHNFENAVVVPGFLTSKDMASFLVFYKESVYKSDNINNFRMDFDNTFDDNKTPINSQVNFIALQSALDINAKKDSTTMKKIFIHFTDKNCISCSVMDSVTYSNPIVSKFLNTNFHNVRFDVNSTDTIVFNGKPILPSEDYLFNNFAVSVLKGKMKTPAVAFFTEENQIIFPIQEYLNRNSFEVVINYIEDEQYIKMSFQDYAKTFESNITSTHGQVDQLYQTLGNTSNTKELIEELILQSVGSEKYAN